LTLCRDYTLRKTNRAGTHYSPLYCRAWTCSICAPRRKKQLIALAFAGRPATFLTLTVNPAEFETPAQAARALAHAWKLLVKRTRRQYKLQEFPFLAIFEKTRKGWPHLHVITRVKWIDQQWLSDQMADLINAPVVDVRRVFDAGRVAAYVAKYVGKDPHRFATCKRYWSSRNWDLRPQYDDLPDGEVEPIFDIIRFQIETIRESCERCGDNITVTRTGFSILFEPPPAARP